MADEMAGNILARTESAAEEAPKTADLSKIPPEPDDSIAILLLDPGAPNSSDEIQPFLKRAYSDKRVFDSPLGSLWRGLFTRIFRPCAAGELRRALEAVGGSANLQNQLLSKAKVICDLLNSMEGMPHAEPFAASLFSDPTVSQVMDDIRSGNFSNVVVFWTRPFSSALINSATDVLLSDEEQHPGTPPSVLVHGWLNEKDVVHSLAASIRSALNQISENERGSVHIALILRALPIQGNIDPALQLSRKLAAAAVSELKIHNEFSVVYLDGIEPYASLRPDFDDLLIKLKSSKPHLLCVPFMGICDDLAVLGGLKGDAASRAIKKGFPKVSFAETPFADEACMKMAADAIVAHLQRSIEFSQSVIRSSRRKS